MEHLSDTKLEGWIQLQLQAARENKPSPAQQLVVEECSQLLNRWSEQSSLIAKYRKLVESSMQAKDLLRVQLTTELDNLSVQFVEQKSQPVRVASIQPATVTIGASAKGRVPTPATAPIVHVLTPAACQHVITFTNSGQRSSQPNGSSGAEIYIAVGDESPMPEDRFRFAAWAIRTPHLLHFSDLDAGKTAHYRLRWINAKGESGPWSETATAQIPTASEAA